MLCVWVWTWGELGRRGIITCAPREEVRLEDGEDAARHREALEGLRRVLAGLVDEDEAVADVAQLVCRVEHREEEEPPEGGRVLEVVPLRPDLLPRRDDPREPALVDEGGLEADARHPLVARDDDLDEVVGRSGRSGVSEPPCRSRRAWRQARSAPSSTCREGGGHHCEERGTPPNDLTGRGESPLVEASHGFLVVDDRG